MKEQEMRERNVFMLNRWDYYRMQAKEQKEREYQYSKMVDMIKFWNRYIIAD